MILDETKLRSYVQRFNTTDDEFFATSIDNRHAADWLAGQIPRLDCPDGDIERTYYFRWWTYRKHIRQTPEGHIVSEFLPDVPWAGKYNAIACAAGHHLYEGRWLRDAASLLDYVRFWYRGGSALHSYSNWVPDGLWQLCSTTGDFSSAIDLLPELVAAQQKLENDHRHESGLFWSSDDRDGGEFSISGPGLRTTLNCYIYANQRAIAAIAGKAGNTDLQQAYTEKANHLAELIRARLWDERAQFYRCIPLADCRTPMTDWSFDHMDPNKVVRELWGYMPWYFNIAGEGRDQAWRTLFSKDGFHGEYGPTTAERSHPLFGIYYTGKELQQWLEARGPSDKVEKKGHECLWNGPSWPYATSQALTALANHISHSAAPAVNASEYVDLLARYARSHQLTRQDGAVVPWIDENLNPDTGDWISRTRLKDWANGTWDPSKGGYERGKDYNHSTFCDLVISGLFGIQPGNGCVEIRPLLSGSGWPYVCLDGVPCHGHLLTVLYDYDGSRYGRGKGFQVLIDGAQRAAFSEPRQCMIPLT